MKVRYRLSEISEKIIFCDLKFNDIEIISCLSGVSNKYLDGKVRGGIASNKRYKVYAFSDDKDYLKSSSKFKKEIVYY